MNWQAQISQKNLLIGVHTISPNTFQFATSGGSF